MKNKKLFLLDVFPLLYRSHFVMMNQPLVSSSGLNTSAILGFCNFLFQILFKEKPTHIAAAFDNYSFERTMTLSSYKANRERMPDEIGVAKEYVTRIIDALHIKTIQLKGHEADDVIGTIAEKASEENFEVYIVSPDKDFAQLVKKDIYLYRPPFKGVNFDILDAEKVEAKYGVPPLQIPDMLALKGDASDNIPGVPKIGDKTAAELLKEYSSLEKILEQKEHISKASIKKTLIENEDIAIISKQLAIINTDLPLNFSEEDFSLKGPDTEGLLELLDELEFVRLKERIFSNSFFKKAIGSAANKENETIDTAACDLQEVSGSDAFAALMKRVKEDKKFYFLTQATETYTEIFFPMGEKVYAYKLTKDAIPSSLLSILQSETVEKITYNAKCFLKFLYSFGKDLQGPVYDLSLMYYIASPGTGHHIDKIMGQELGQSYRETDLRKKLCCQASSLTQLYNKINDRLENSQIRLYKETEYPLVPVLARMEVNGIKIDRKVLKEASIELQREMEKAEEKIFELAGERFNVRSTRQTSDQLSRILKDTPLKKTRTGQLSTAESSLQDYAREYEIAEHLLRFRKLSKLISTYTESLPRFINDRTGRIHADFLQTITATGRLSCTNPNLQNLPIRSDEGKEVRKALVPENTDFLILAADYSQIELRLLAAISKDRELIEAFAQDRDIHAITAAKVFNVSESEVTDDMRSKAKMVNYGIAYGISPFGLAKNLKITMSEAREIIDQYFQKFPDINSYVKETIEFVRENNYSVTLTGRRRYVENINSRNGTERRAAERIAINAPIQGLAADLIKLSMIRIDEALKAGNMKTRMIIQVHDELVFEVYKPEIKEVAKLVKEKMEDAITLPVPIKANLKLGENWLETEEYKI